MARTTNIRNGTATTTAKRKRAAPRMHNHRRKVEIHPDCASEARKALEPHLGWIEKLLPGWVQRVVLDNSYKQEEFDCQIITDYDYRNAAIYVYPSWLMLPADKRRAKLLHEVCHIVLAPMSDVALELVQKALPPDQWVIIKRAWEQSCEQTTQDLAALLAVAVM